MTITQRHSRACTLTCLRAALLAGRVRARARVIYDSAARWAQVNDDNIEFIVVRASARTRTHRKRPIISVRSLGAICAADGRQTRRRRRRRRRRSTYRVDARRRTRARWRLSAVFLSSAVAVAPRALELALDIRAQRAVRAAARLQVGRVAAAAWG